MNFRWLAVYDDDSYIDQFDTDNNRERSLAEIDRKRMVKFALVDENNNVPLVQHLDKDQRLIFRRRVKMTVGGEQEIYYMVGWQQTVEDKNIQHITYIFPDGHIENAGRFRDSHPVFQPVIPIPGEEIATEVVDL